MPSIRHTHSKQLAAFKWERMKMRHALFAKNSEWKEDEELADDESDMDEDTITAVEDRWLATEIDKAQKKFAKDNAKAEAEDKPRLPQSELDEKIEALKEEHEKFVGERGTEEATLKGATKSEEKIREMITKHDEKIRTHKLQMTDKDEGKEVSLGTRSAYVFLSPFASKFTCYQLQ